MNPKDWITLTSIDQDFRITSVTPAASLLSTWSGQPLLGVAKKNASVLRRLIKWLSAAPPEVLNACPTLIIDDEADQASVNTGTGDSDRTVINDRIVTLLETLPRCAYVGYTATPFANVFIDPTHPRDLYPRDFIVDLPTPAEYFGAQRIFGRERVTQEELDEAVAGLDVIRTVPESEVDAVKPQGRSWQTFAPELPASLRDAIDYFVLATAARAVRGQADAHSSMLIHTTLYADVHARFRPVVEGFLGDRLRSLGPARY